MENNENSSSARPWQSYHTVYTNAKAGMESVDKEKVQRVVYEMSKGSKYFENEERKEAYMKHKIEKMREHRSKLTPADIAHYQQIADKRILDLEATRDLSRVWLHVDMDAFYAAAETLCNPSLKGKPMAVGGLSMISTANYEARKFGVRAAMPGFIARKLCPQLILVPTDFKKYTYYSDLTRKVFQKYDPNFLAASLDEAYLDITNLCRERGMTGGEVTEELRESVHKETGLTCSAGVAPNRLLAKVCSDINKPNGQFVLPNEHMAVMTFISSLPIRKIGGIGKVTENVLKEVFEITTCEDMLQKSSFICALFSRRSADFFLSVGLGLGRTDAPQVTMRKSISSERTFSCTEDEASLHKKLGDIAENLSMDMKKEGLCGRTLTLKLKTSCFEVRTRAVTLSTYICSSEDILRHAIKLLKAELPVSLRLMGLRMSQFSEGKKGVATDPKQKTLSNFLVTEYALGRKPGIQMLLGSSNEDNTLYTDRETSADKHGTCGSNDQVIDHQIPNMDHVDSTYGVSNAETMDDFDRQVDDSSDNVDNHDTVKSDTTLFSVPTAESVERYSSPVQFEETRVDRQNGVNSCSNDEQEKPVFWLDDYRCSVCGIEMPSCFLEERREHFDFHFAERLQEEESSNSRRILNPRQRSIRKDQVSTSRQRKKMKGSPSECKHIPIDMFFTKTSQNF